MAQISPRPYYLLAIGAILSSLVLGSARMDAVADDSVAGDAVAGDAVAGDSVAGDSVAGDSVAGDAESEAPKAADAAAIEFVEAKVKPLLEARCFECHGPDAKEPKGGLRLDSLAMMLEGGDSGAAIEPGHPDKSVLIDAINYGDFEMPPKSRLPAGEIAILTRWVEMGAPWPAGETPVAAVKSEPFPLQQRKREHWAWQPLGQPPVPSVRASDWPLDGLDHFILARLEEAGLQPAEPADRRTLIRRAYLDLIGMPPPPKDVIRFIKDRRSTPKAFAGVIDRLLRSQRFGERWARHWLDLVRFAETRGHESDFAAPYSYQYRDYVIRALNDDVAYDQFLTEHLAGDLLTDPRLNQRTGGNESVLGTGFWFLGEWVHSPVYIRKDETDRFDNMIDTMARTFMGVTVGCARCHDHKFDAISAEDYYALVGYLQSSQFRQVRFESQPHNRRVAMHLAQLRRHKLEEIHPALAATLKPAAADTAKLLLATKAMTDGADAGAVSSQLQLDAEVLKAWKQEVERAGNDKAHPLYIWAQALSHRGDSAGVRAILQQFADKPAQNAAQPESVIVDYGNLQPGQWMQDGFTFGSAPVQPGELWFTDSPRSVGVYTTAAARRDPLWDGLVVAKEAEGAADSESTEFKEGLNWVQAGKTIRTPTFEVGQQGKVFLRVKGAARIYAAVTSHRMIAGPLHNSLLHRFDTKNEWKWISHDLSRYKGLRAHLEITPDDGQEFMLSMVAHQEVDLSDSKPWRPVLASGDVPDSLEALADSYQRLVSDVVARLADGSIATGPQPQQDAELANWMLQNPALFSTDVNIPAIARWTAAKKHVASGIMKQSKIAPAMWDGDAEDEVLLIRGSWNNAGPVVPRRLLQALDGGEHPAPRVGSGRLELARQMVDPQQNPLTPRVIVNRVWHHLFGRGIVQSVDNFGVLGTPPSHPELLDRLASDFVADGWSLKRLVRRIVLSQTYQMSSRPVNALAEETDPTNQLLHRQRVRRLEGEAIRDSMLAISGRINDTMFGPGVPVHLTKHMNARGIPSTSGPLDGDGRRTIYLKIRRNFLSPFMLAFDAPIPFTTIGRRNVSNVPSQALILMNDPFVIEQARLWALQLLAGDAITPQERITEAYEAAYSRKPTNEEIADAIEFLQRQATQYGANGDEWLMHPQAWADWCHVLWNVKEFIYRN